MKKNEKYEIQKTNYGVTWINVLQKNPRGETMKICITECKNHGGKHALPVLWYQAGYTRKIFNTYLCVDTYVYDSEGGCRSDYNPTVLPSGRAIDFTWLFENTPDNKQKLIDECLRRFEAATGSSATELNMEKIRKFAKENGLELFDKLPDGWKITDIFAPRGSVRIAKGSFAMRADDGKLIANPEYREALLIQRRS